MTRHADCAQHKEESRLVSHLPEQRESNNITKKSKKHQSSYQKQHSHITTFYLFAIQTNLKISPLNQLTYFLVPPKMF